ncbi:MAG: hypothetical protein LLG97_20360 [Deltaproteobacteria bacterium]|nr:hypothetical protein [Deltaproteobacteria bacterium]
MIAAIGLLTGFRTDVLRADWKYAGGALPDREIGNTLEFYDAETVEYLSNGDVKVWVKAIDKSDVDGLVAGEKAIMTKAAEKTAKSYYPPYFLSNPDPDASADACIEMILWEEAANHDDVKPRAKMLYEINCRERMIQTVSAITYKRDGTTTFASDFDRWSPIPPGSTGDVLRRILCK